jgi:putative nucleotidyltransferase with HDIG domain
MNLSPKGQLYIVIVSAAGLLVVGHCITMLLAEPIGGEWAVLAGLTLLSGSFTVRVPSFQARISVSETFVFTSVLLFGTCAGTITVALDTLVAALSSQRRAREPLRVLFNLSSASLSIWTASHIFYLVAEIQPLSVEPTRVPELLWPLIMLTAIHFALNSGLVAAALATERNESAFTIWRRIFPWLSLNYFGGASVAALLVSYTRTVDFMALSIIVPLLVISYLTYKMALGRVEDAIQHVEQVNRLYLSTIETLATAIDAKDQVTHGHIRRVQRFAVGLAEKVGVRDRLQIQALEAAALLHDMGKIAVPEHILNKPSRLTPGEFEKMKLHASVGANILSSINFPYPVVPIVRHHHENWDGTGYPDGLRTTEIPLGARILAVVDCFDALTSDRPYRPRLSDQEAVAILMERRGTMYDPLVVDRFVAAKDELAAALVTGMDTPVEITELLQPTVPHAAAANTPPVRLLNHLELQHAARTVLVTVRDGLLTTLVMVQVTDRSRDELVVIDAVGPTAERYIGGTINLGSRVSGWVAANGRPIINTDARLELPTAVKADGDFVCTAIPIRLASEIAGVLVAIRPASEPFQQGEIAFLENITAKFAEPPIKDLLSQAISSKTQPPKRANVVH